MNNDSPAPGSCSNCGNYMNNCSRQCLRYRKKPEKAWKPDKNPITTPLEQKNPGQITPNGAK